MRTLLRKIPTGEYYQTLSRWTTDPNDAYDFRTINPAIKFVHLAHLPQMELVLSFEAGHSTAIPLEKFKHP